jgi:hypothetical protein
MPTYARAFQLCQEPGRPTTQDFKGSIELVSCGLIYTPSCQMRSRVRCVVEIRNLRDIHNFRVARQTFSEPRLPYFSNCGADPIRGKLRFTSLA